MLVQGLGERRITDCTFLTIGTSHRFNREKKVAVTVAALKQTLAEGSLNTYNLNIASHRYSLCED